MEDEEVTWRKRPILNKKTGQTFNNLIQHGFPSNNRYGICSFVFLGLTYSYQYLFQSLKLSGAMEAGKHYDGQKQKKKSQGFFNFSNVHVNQNV